MLGPRLEGSGVALAPPQIEDIDLFCAWFADEEITRYMLVRFPPSHQQEAEWYQQAASGDNSVHWSVIADERTIGSTAIHSIDWINRHGYTGTMIGDRAQWGKGHGSEVVRLRTAYAFNELGLERLETQSFTSNTPMHRALERAGYRTIGTRRHYIYRGGRWHDTYIFELLREDWLR